jgi:hypothetical protein
MNYDQMIDLQNVGKGKTAVLKLSYNATFDQIYLTLGGGLAKTDIGRIEGKANGTTFFVDDGSLIGVRDAYQGVFVDPNVITIDFTDPNTRGGAAAQYLASVPRNLLNSLTFEIEVKASAPDAATIVAEASYRGPTPNPFILCRRDFNVPLAINGENDIILPVAVSGGLVKRIWLHHTGHVQKAELRGDGTPQIRAKVGSITHYQKRNRLVPQANLLVLDFIADGNLMGMLNTAAYKECLLRITTDAPDTVKAYFDYVNPLQKLS